jgi:mono/diheme cytochrome c family protein
MMSKLVRLVLTALPIAAASVAAQGPAPAQATPYKVVDGYKVDAFTMTGFRTWRAAACDRCHGANQEGLVGPSLVNSLKVLSKDDFIKTVRDGRQEKGMISFAANPTVMTNIDALYAYLKGRSDGAITRARVEPMDAPGSGS